MFVTLPYIKNIKPTYIGKNLIYSHHRLRIYSLDSLYIWVIKMIGSYESADDLDIWQNHDERLENDEISAAEQGFMQGFLNDQAGDLNAV